MLIAKFHLSTMVVFTFLLVQSLITLQLKI